MCLFCFSFSLVFETGSCFVAQAGLSYCVSQPDLKLQILPTPPEHWDYRSAPPYPAHLFLKKSFKKVLEWFGYGLSVSP
jgi:hypothetical protein